jgi:hypothetical protein
MRHRLTGAVVLLTALAVAAAAMTVRSMSAYVVSVDLKAKSITVKHSIDEGKKWTESTFPWDDETTWSRADKKIWEETPATAEVAKTLKKDDKVRIEITKDGESVHLDRLMTLPPDAPVH